MRLRASESGCSGWMVSGLTTMPDSNFLTRRTSSACLGMSRFLWMTPSPPDWAMVMAIWLSVTVSMAEESSGMPSSMVEVSLVLVSAEVGRTAEAAGSNKTSSKVSASRICMPNLQGVGPFRVMARHHTQDAPEAKAGMSRLGRPLLNPALRPARGSARPRHRSRPNRPGSPRASHGAPRRNRA